MEFDKRDNSSFFSSYLNLQRLIKSKDIINFDENDVNMFKYEFDRLLKYINRIFIKNNLLSSDYKIKSRWEDTEFKQKEVKDGESTVLAETNFDKGIVFYLNNMSRVQQNQKKKNVYDVDKFISEIIFNTIFHEPVHVYQFENMKQGKLSYDNYMHSIEALICSFDRKSMIYEERISEGEAHSVSLEFINYIKEYMKKDNGENDKWITKRNKVIGLYSQFPNFYKNGKLVSAEENCFEMIENLEKKQRGTIKAIRDRYPIFRLLYTNERPKNFVELTQQYMGTPPNERTELAKIYRFAITNQISENNVIFGSELEKVVSLYGEQAVANMMGEIRKSIINQITYNARTKNELIPLLSDNKYPNKSVNAENVREKDDFELQRCRSQLHKIERVFGLMKENKRITPSSISSAGIQYAQENPGRVSVGVKKVSSIIDITKENDGKIL